MPQRRMSGQYQEGRKRYAPAGGDEGERSAGSQGSIAAGGLITSDQDRQVAPAAPQDTHTRRPAPFFAAQVAAEAGDPQHGLLDGWNGRVRGRRVFVDVTVQRPPLVVTQNHRAWIVGALPGQIAQGHDPQGDRGVHDNRFEEPIGRF